MANRLYSGDQFPGLQLKLAGGNTFQVPVSITSRYLIAIFYRGHWCPYCRRQLTGIEKYKTALEALGATIIAGSADDEAHAFEVAREVSFPIAFGMTRDDADRLGA